MTEVKTPFTSPLGLKDLDEASHIMIWRTNSEHLCDFVNEALLRFTGGDFENLEGLNWLDFIHSQDRERVTDIQIYCRRHHIPFRNEYRVKTLENTYRWILDSAVPQFSQHGEFLGYLGYIIDIHEQKMREMELKLRQSKLEKQILEISEQEQRRIGQDIHDGLAQSLLAIALKAQLLTEKLQDNKSSEVKIAEEIVQQSNQAIQETRLIAKSLAPINLAKHGLRSGLSDMSHHVKETFAVDLQCEYLGEESRVTPNHAFQLYRIVQSAVSNSIRHGEAKRVTVQLDVTQGHKGRLVIADNGKGFDPKMNKSPGMGCLIMEHRAKMMGGGLTLDSRPGHGAKLICEFDLQTHSEQV